MSWDQGNQKPLKREDINKEIMELEGYLEDNKAKYYLYKFLKDNVTFTTQLLTGVELFPFQHMAVKAMMENDYFLGIWCLDENEYVLTENGFKKIKNISVGEKVRSRKKLNMMSDKWVNPKEDGLYVKTASGESFKAKLGHKVLTYKNGEFEFKKIQNLTKDDYLPVKLGTEQWGDKDITKDSEIKNSPYLFYMLGYVLGDGWINKDGVNYCTECSEVHSTIKNFIDENGYKSYSRQRSENLSFYEYAIFNRDLVKFVEGLGWDISKKSKDKVIADFLLEAPKGDLCALIGGLFDADGYASFLKTSSKVGLKSTALEMLRQVKMLLNNIGVESNLRQSGENNGVPYYDLVLANDHDSLKKFQKYIDFIVPDKKQNLEKIVSRSETRNYQNKMVPSFGDAVNLSDEKSEILKAIKKENVVFSKIKTIEPCQTVSVDITVEGEENYIGNGLVHHNSRGMSKSFSTGIFALLDACVNQGVHIGIISKSFRQCITKEALIPTKRGFIKAEDLNVGDFVFSEKGYNRILNKWTNEKDSILKLKTRRGYEVKGKKNHQILCLDKANQVKIYKDLSEIKKGEFVAIQTQDQFFPSGMKTKEDGYFYGTTLVDSKKDNEKLLPDFVFKENKAFVSNLLLGLFDTSGSVSKSEVELTLSSLGLIKQIQILLLKFGIVSTIQKEKFGKKIKICDYETFKRGSYKLRITSEEFIEKLSEEIGFKFSKKQKKILKKDSNKLKELTGIYWDKLDSVCVSKDEETIDIEVENEHCYTGNGFINHNSKMIFRKIEDIAQDNKAELFRQCLGKVSKSNDEWSMQIGKSRITALPLGDGEKLRGFRFQRIIIDELLLMPEKVLNEVIMPFLAVVENPTERQKVRDAEDAMIKLGKMTEEERTEWPSNKMIGLSSASYKFEHLYKMYQQYENMIFNPGSKNQGRRCIMQFSYDCAPKTLYDENLISQARGTMSQSQIDREFNAQFTDDSAGYFKISKMAECTIEDGESPCVEVAGEEGSEYILAFDPSWSEAETSDDFAIQVIKLMPDKKKGVLVHSYALPGTNLKKHMIYFKYILDHFNTVMIVGDYNGGVQFINSCNESNIFKKDKLQIGIFDADFNNPHDYIKDLKEARKQYNKESKKICHLRKPLATWIRSANEMLQTAFDRKKLYFAATAMDENYSMQKSKKIPIENLKFSKYDEEKTVGAKMIDFVEHQKDMIDLTKAECALIQVSSSAGGTQSFDLPSNLKRQKGIDRPRKDSYSALVLGNWGMNIFYDMMDVPEDNNQGFTPMFL